VNAFGDFSEQKADSAVDSLWNEGNNIEQLIEFQEHAVRENAIIEE